MLLVLFFTFYRILIVISIGVIISCALSVALVLVCCFWNKCPLYSTCGSSYQHNDTIAFSRNYISS